MPSVKPLPLLLFISAMLTAHLAVAQVLDDAPYSTVPAVAQPPGAVYAPVPVNGNVPAVIDSVGEGAIPALPLEIQSVGSMTYINGGIGDEEIAELKSRDKEFNVQVLITAPQGEFIGDATLTLRDAGGNSLLTLGDAGPYFYVHLPQGAYTLEVSSGAETKKAKIKVGSGLVKHHVSLGQSDGPVTKRYPGATIH